MEQQLSPMVKCFRRMLVACLSLVTTLSGAAALEATTQTHTGPWFEPGARERADLWSPGMRGTRLVLNGRVLDTQARAIAGALIEYWHTDAAGNYPPMRASTRSNKDGAFVVRTILPGHHQGYRARHIHFVISHGAFPTWVTRVYFRGDEHLDEAPWPQLAITLEEAEVNGERRLLGNLQFVVAK